MIMIANMIMQLYIIVMLAFFLLGNEKNLDKVWMDGSLGWRELRSQRTELHFVDDTCGLRLRLLEENGKLPSTLQKQQFLLLQRFILPNGSKFKMVIGTQWAPTSYEWNYNPPKKWPYKWVCLGLFHPYDYDWSCGSRINGVWGFICFPMRSHVMSWWMTAWFLQDHAASRYIFTCLSKVFGLKDEGWTGREEWWRMF